MGSPPNAVGPVSDGIMDPLSTLAHDATQNPSALLEGLKKALANPYDKKTCPNGVINLGTAESHLMADVLLEKLNSPDIRQVTPAMLRYGTMYGSHQLRQAVANLINKHFRPVKAITPENITAHAGCGAAINNIAQALTNPGEGVLVPTPYYGGFDFDLRMYAQAKIVPVNTFSASHFMVTVPELEEAYQAAVSEGITVRVLLLTNPSNPSGRTQPADDVRAALEWAKSKKLQAVVDEIYALSTFSDDPVPFTSAYALANLPDPQNTHLLYGMSKDFCINGVRMGFVISYNKELLESLHMFAIFTCVSSMADASVGRMLSDANWVDSFVAENRRKLKEQYEKTTAELTRIGVPFLPANAGMFLLLNLSQWYSQTTSSEQDAPWRAMWNELIGNGVYFAPGEAFRCAETGWFRMVFTLPWDTVKLGLERLEKTIKSR